MRGYPIRTPSDHSSVDSSPRLIAASHVLHRLLVPRHPPCALKNLHTTQQSKNCRPRNKRCSRPLCRSQTTNPTPATTAGQPRNKPKRYPPSRPERQQATARSLRTQQRTHNPPPTTPTRSTPTTPEHEAMKSTERRNNQQKNCNSQRSTHEHHRRRTLAGETASGPPNQKAGRSEAP